MTNIGKLLTAYMDATGHRDAKTISEATGVAISTVYRWIASLSSETPKTEKILISESLNSEKTALSSENVNGVPRARTSYTGVKNPLLSPEDEMRHALTGGNTFEKFAWTDDERLIVTCATERAKWLAEFGSEKRLEAALVQAAGWIRKNDSSRMLTTAARAQLAQQIARIMDGDRRYASKANGTSEQKNTLAALSSKQPIASLQPVVEEW